STMYIPAAEFRELDGKELSAGSTMKFRIPPLIDRTWFQPEAILVNIEYSVISKNPVLKTVEVILRLVGLSSGNNTASVLGRNNYWTPLPPCSIQSAITQACRENITIARLSVCQDEVLTQAAHLNAEGLARVAAGQYAEAQPPLEHALAIREKA